MGLVLFLKRLEELFLIFNFVVVENDRNGVDVNVLIFKVIMVYVDFLGVVFVNDLNFVVFLGDGRKYWYGINVVRVFLLMLRSCWVGCLVRCDWG